MELNKSSRLTSVALPLAPIAKQFPLFDTASMPKLIGLAYTTSDLQITITRLNPHYESIQIVWACPDIKWNTMRNMNDTQHCFVE